MTTLELLLLSVLAVIYIASIFTVALVTFRNGHWILGMLGIFFPVFWLIGVVIPPTADAALSFSE